jgi:ATP-dependent protease ClpP protease subunit
MKKIKKIYSENTKIPKEELDKILKHDIWWEAEKCLEYGLIDEII